ncbi:MAG: DUF4199 domain-containing protein [Blastocatellales bacterium]
MKTEIKWGLIFTLVAFAWITLEWAVGLHGKFIGWQPILTNIFVIPAVWVMVLAIKDKRRELGGKITFSQAVLCGIGISVIVAVLAPLTQWIFHNFVSPHFFENAINYAVQNGKATREQAEAYFNLKSYMLQGSLGGLVMGTLTSLILAAIMRSKNS